MIDSIEIRRGEQDEEAWDGFVRRCSQGSVFHLSAWKRVVEKTFGHKSHYLTAVSHGQIRGICPLFEVKSLLFGHSIISVPCAEIGGILAKDRAVESKLLESAQLLFKEKKADYLELRNQEPYPGIPVKDLYYNFTKKIFPDHDANLKAIPRKSRAMVRKAIKNGLVSETGHHLLPLFYDLLSRNYHRLGTPIFTVRLFENFLSEFDSKANLLIVKDSSGHHIAGVLYFVDRDRIMPYYAGSDFRYRHLGPNDFMYWELMRLAVENKLTLFDYGRSKAGTGSFKFKVHWGFEPSPLSYQYVMKEGEPMPNLSPANPKYQRKIRIWKRMPLAASRLFGPYISKYLV